MKKTVVMKTMRDGKASGEILRFTTSEKLEDLFGDLETVLRKRWAGTGAAEIIGTAAAEGTYLKSTGVSSFVTRGLVMTNDPGTEEADVAHTGRHSCIIGAGVGPASGPGPLAFSCGSGEIRTDYSAVFTVYPEGYVLNTGQTGYNLFGASHQRYLVSIGRRNAKSGAISAAHVFPDIRSLTRYVGKHRDALEYLAAEQGWSYTAEPACPLFAASMEEIPAKDKKNLPELEALLEEISGKEPEPEDTGEGTATPEEMKAEALHRMQKLNLWKNAISAFRKDGRVFMSEAGGILYDPDEHAVQAIKEAGKYSGVLPYAVIVSRTGFGTCYSVLYVGIRKSEWILERPGRHGFVIAFTYNADAPECSEFGSIGVAAANGGLVRTA